MLIMCAFDTQFGDVLNSEQCCTDCWGHPRYFSEDPESGRHAR
jgi:hypothetical protein